MELLYKATHVKKYSARFEMRSTARKDVSGLRNLLSSRHVGNMRSGRSRSGRVCCPLQLKVDDSGEKSFVMPGDDEAAEGEDFGAISKILYAVEGDHGKNLVVMIPAQQCVRRDDRLPGLGLNGDRGVAGDVS